MPSRLSPPAALAALAALLVAAPVAGAQVTYPGPANPKGSTKKPKGPHRTLRVCKNKRCTYRTITRAVRAAKAGDTIRVGRGVYHEGVIVQGNKKRYLKIIGDKKRPDRVVIDARGVKGARRQNAIAVVNANKVTLQGLKARNQKGNGFYVVNADGYRLDRLITAKTGVYGIYAFNTTGGSMTNSLAYYASDGAFYIGQTPPQAKPKRTVVRNVTAWGSTVGFSATNMRYVTITKSRFFNNGIGVVPNALDSEKYPPAEDNVFSDNDIFWNNFDVYRQAPFTPNAGNGFVYPPGAGFVVFSGRRNVVENNRIDGNFLAGALLVQNVFLKARDAIDLKDNVVRDNVFGANGADRNGRDLVYTGNGGGNCFEGNTGVSRTLPDDPSVFPECPGPKDNQDSDATLLEVAGWGVGDKPKYRESWIQTAHPEREDITPLIDWVKGGKYGPTRVGR